MKISCHSFLLKLYHNNINDCTIISLLVSDIRKKCSNIKIVMSDVDGVLTDGGMYYSDKGDVMKKFHTRDGMGVSLLRKNGIPTIIITKEKTKIVRMWAKRMKIEKLHDGILQKETIVERLCETFNVKTNELAYIGDDVNDLKIMSTVGFSAVPADATIEAKQITDYICKSRGGEGVLREITDLILSVRFSTKKKSY